MYSSDCMIKVHLGGQNKLTFDSFVSGSLCSMICAKMHSTFTMWLSRLLAWLTSEGSLRAHQDWPDSALCCMLARAQPRKTEPVSSRSLQWAAWTFVVVCA